MSHWCSECYREPHHKCDETCPVFGLYLEDLAKKYFETVRHGKWVHINRTEDNTFCAYNHICTNCNEVNGNKSKYCPNCGAKMDLG